MWWRKPDTYRDFRPCFDFNPYGESYWMLPNSKHMEPNKTPETSMKETAYAKYQKNQ